MNLVCWMSEDPLVTLTAIWTHRPERCWLLYDKDHKRVCRSVYRLLEHAPELPAAELRLVQSNKMRRRDQQGHTAARAARRTLDREYFAGQQSTCAGAGRAEQRQTGTLLDRQFKVRRGGAWRAFACNKLCQAGASPVAHGLHRGWAIARAVDHCRRDRLRLHSQHRGWRVSKISRTSKTLKRDRMFR